jgi:predicted GTPase
MADVIVINKVDSATPEDLDALRNTIAALNGDAETIEATSPISIEEGVELDGARVIVVEDGPTLTHGEMGYGAGVVAARQAGAEPVDPRPWAVGSIKDVFERYSHMGPLLPAMGYSDQQRAELSQTINAADVDAVLIATPIDLRKIVDIQKPAVRVAYELDDAATAALDQTLRKRLGL